MIEIRKATKAQSEEIAELIMISMTDDCCLHFCGEGYGPITTSSTIISTKPIEKPIVLRFEC